MTPIEIGSPIDSHAPAIMAFVEDAGTPARKSIIPEVRRAADFFPFFSEEHPLTIELHFHEAVRDSETEKNVAQIGAVLNQMGTVLNNLLGQATALAEKVETLEAQLPLPKPVDDPAPLPVEKRKGIIETARTEGPVEEKK